MQKSEHPDGAAKVYNLSSSWWATKDEEVKVLILKANGNGFCAGHAIIDPSEMSDVYPDDTSRAWNGHGKTSCGSLLWPPLNLESSKATIAQVHGYCVGGGPVYGFLCDITVASDDTYFQMPLPQGFSPCRGPDHHGALGLDELQAGLRVPVPRKTLSAEDAKETQLVQHEVVRDTPSLKVTVEEMAATIARGCPPSATIMTIERSVKRAWEGMGMRVDAAEHQEFLHECVDSPMSTSSWQERAAACPARHHGTGARGGQSGEVWTTNRRPDLGCSEAGHPVARPMAAYGETV